MSLSVDMGNVVRVNGESYDLLPGGSRSLVTWVGPVIGLDCSQNVICRMLCAMVVTDISFKCETAPDVHFVCASTVSNCQRRGMLGVCFNQIVAK